MELPEAYGYRTQMRWIRVAPWYTDHGLYPRTGLKAIVLGTLGVHVQAWNVAASDIPTQKEYHSRSADPEEKGPPGLPFMQPFLVLVRSWVALKSGIADTTEIPRPAAYTQDLLPQFHLEPWSCNVIPTRKASTPRLGIRSCK